jgi:aryl-alcohol dehydrogenase-like predicted oxidoreductase
LAVAWVASHPAVTAPIIGGRNLKQLKDSLKSVDIDMTTETKNIVYRIIARASHCHRPQRRKNET